MQLSKLGLSYHRLNHIFISHLHGDHYLGLMGLLFTMHLNSRESPLHLYGFRGLADIVYAHLYHSKSSLNFKVHFHELNAVDEVVLDDEVLTVRTIPMVHKIDCVGFIFQEKQKPRRINKEKLFEGMRIQHIALLKTGQDVKGEDDKVIYRNEDFTLPPKRSLSYAYCSDTAYSPGLATLVSNVDLLYHEATFMEADKGKAIETKHSTAMDAARIAAAAGVGKLVIGHFSARYKELEELLGEARSLFPFTELAIECNTFDLGQDDLPG